MYEGGAFKADIDECALHSGQHPHDLPQTDVAHVAALDTAFYVKFLHGALFHKGDAGFERCYVDQYVFRSEEHTSELPVTNAHLVCRLLLEKKKQTNINLSIHIQMHNE